MEAAELSEEVRSKSGIFELADRQTLADLKTKIFDSVYLKTFFCLSAVAKFDLLKCTFFKVCLGDTRSRLHTTSRRRKTSQMFSLILIFGISSLKIHLTIAQLNLRAKEKRISPHGKLQKTFRH